MSSAKLWGVLPTLLILGSGCSADREVEVAVGFSNPNVRTTSGGGPQAQSTCHSVMSFLVHAPDVQDFMPVPVDVDVDSNLAGGSEGDVTALSAAPLNVRIKSGSNRDFVVTGSTRGGGGCGGSSFPMFGRTLVGDVSRASRVSIGVQVSVNPFIATITAPGTSTIPTDSPFVVAVIPATSCGISGGSAQVFVQSVGLRFDVFDNASPAVGSFSANTHYLYPLPPDREYRLRYEAGGGHCCFSFHVGNGGGGATSREFSVDHLQGPSDNFCPTP